MLYFFAIVLALLVFVCVASSLSSYSGKRRW
jgi:hypothetical protein